LSAVFGIINEAVLSKRMFIKEDIDYFCSYLSFLSGIMKISKALLLKSALIGIEALAFASFSNGKKKEKWKGERYHLLWERLHLVCYSKSCL